MPELQLVQKINSAELNRNLDRIQAIISQIKGPYGLYVSILLLISSYWALTLCELYLRRRRGMANHLSLLWRPKFAFSLWIPLAVPAYAYGSWKFQSLSCKDPIILDFFDKVSAVRPMPNLDFSNLRDSLLFAFSLGVLWVFYFGLMKLLGMAATRLGFK